MAASISLFLVFCASFGFGVTLLAVILLASLPRTGVDAKEPPLNVIELYDGPNGAAYLQIAEFTINGKAEVRACGGMERIDKSAYSKLAKVPLAGASTLEAWGRRSNEDYPGFGADVRSALQI